MRNCLDLGKCFLHKGNNFLHLGMTLIFEESSSIMGKTPFVWLGNRIEELKNFFEEREKVSSIPQFDLGWGGVKIEKLVYFWEILLFLRNEKTINSSKNKPISSIFSLCPFLLFSFFFPRQKSIYHCVSIFFLLSIHF